MPKNTWVNVAGTWREVQNVWMNVGGVWKQKVVPKGNINGTWKEFMQYYLPLYEYGTEYTPIQMGYILGSIVSPNIAYEENADHIRLYINNDSSLFKVGVETTNPVDVTEYSTAKILFDYWTNIETVTNFDFMLDTQPNRGEIDNVARASHGSVGENLEMSLDVSGLSGGYYIKGIVSPRTYRTVEVKIKAIWLE